VKEFSRRRDVVILQHDVLKYDRSTPTVHPNLHQLRQYSLRAVQLSSLIERTHTGPRSYTSLLSEVHSRPFEQVAECPLPPPSCSWATYSRDDDASPCLTRHQQTCDRKSAKGKHTKFSQPEENVKTNYGCPRAVSNCSLTLRLACFG
jgi:hypothetical protein